MRHRHPATEEHLELLGKRVIKLRGAMQLLLAGNLPRLADGADDLRHLRERKERYLAQTAAGTPILAHEWHEYTRSQHHALHPPLCAFHHEVLKGDPTGNLGR